MGWREGFFKYVGPGMFIGAKFGDYASMLAENRFRVAPRAWLKTAVSASATMITSAWCLGERWKYARRVAAVHVAPPVFVLGHWRSGTTLLHNLLCLDARFAYPQFMDVMLPHTFLSGAGFVETVFGNLIPATRFGLDNVPFHTGAPFEEEFALAIATGHSPYMSWAFPHRAAHYDRYLDMAGVSESEVNAWRAAMALILRKLACKYGRPLVLKSPPHTARIRLLLELFPEARFVHIHRHPYAVYRSTRHLHSTCRQYFSLQGTEYDDHARIVSMYRAMHDAYFTQRSLIPAGRFAETSYDRLEREPVAELERIYGELGLPDFAATRPGVESYMASLSGYEKKQYPDLPPEVRGDLLKYWQREFDEWGYAR